MAETLEEHRASIKYKPRRIYGKIISNADRTIENIDEVILRTYSYDKNILMVIILNGT